MKISLLLEREPFVSIFEKTMERHLAATTGRPHRVQWRDLSLLDRRPLAARLGVWLCNPTINAVFSSSALLEVFEIPWREYLHGRSTARTAVHAAYLAAATAPFMRAAIAKHQIVIEPDLDQAARLLIIGGNTRLKIFDFSKRKVTTVLKEGFGTSSITKDIDVRTRHTWIPAPEILEVLDGGLAYVEPLVHGTVADRLSNRILANRALDEVVEACDRLARETARRVPISQYFHDVLSKCMSAARRIESLDHKLAQRSLAWLSRVEAQNASSSIGENIDIEVGESHGDLQPGNVIVERGEIRIIDWESTGVRMRGYDALTLALDSHRAVAGLVDWARRLADSGNSNPGTREAQAALFENGVGERSERRLLLYFAEELRFRLEENLCGPISSPTQGLERLLNELEKERHP